jgi:hypothetical protein
MNNKENKKVWFVTGASKGLGLALTKTLLEAGYRVAATSRNEGQLISSAGTVLISFCRLALTLPIRLLLKKGMLLNPVSGVSKNIYFSLVNVKLPPP